jgi:hypothetical protein
MKQADVTVGGTYLTKISGREEPVVVVDSITGTSHGAFGRETERTYFRVRPAKGGGVLPKSRTAAALSPMVEPTMYRFYAVGSGVQRRSYRVRQDHQSWMNATPDQAPFSVLTGMVDFMEYASPEEALVKAKVFNERMERAGRLQTGTIVVP